MFELYLSHAETNALCNVAIKARCQRWKLYFKIELSLCGKHDRNFVYNEEARKMENASGFIPKADFT
jgi:hypothetical protein